MQRLYDMVIDILLVLVALNEKAVSDHVRSLSYTLSCLPVCLPLCLPACLSASLVL